MAKQINLFILLIISSVICIGESAVTVESMMQSLKLVRGVCQPKFSISDDTITGLQKGVFPDDKAAKCYSHCVFEMTGLMKKSKINYDAAMKQIDILLPDDLKDIYRTGMNMCKDIANDIKDSCEAGYTLIQCLQKNNPQFLFP